MSPAACAGSPPGPRSESPGTAEFCAPSCGSGLAVAERMQHGTSTDFVDVQLGHVLGREATGVEAVLYVAVLKDVGCGVSGAALAPFFAGQGLALRLGNGYPQWARGQVTRTTHR